jgi:hypothetical protein
MEARTRLLRALFFRGGFCGASQEEGRVAFEEARDVANEGLAQIERRLGNLSGAARIAALRTIPGAARLHFWAAISWGQWALHRNKIVAARAGAAGKVRDLATTVVDLDPQLEQGGGYMLLGRLHDQAPWIPFLTGWVSHQQGLVYLRQALEIGPQNTVNQYFLAEAILRHDRAHRDEARRLLLQCANASPRRDFEVEDAHYAEFARRRLADLK